MAMILHAASELTPLAKTGGLGDVLSALPAEQRILGNKVACVLPFYHDVDKRLPQKPRRELSIKVPVGGEEIDAQIYSGRLANGLVVFLVQYDPFFKRPELYGENNRDYPDNVRRFIFFSKAVVQLARHVRPIPQILHVHDWQTALVPAFVKAAGLPFKTVLTIHNLAFQGQFPGYEFALTNLPLGYFHAEGLEMHGGINFLKGGIKLADCVTTVSPRYAVEIQTEEYGCGLAQVLRARSADGSLVGILNGIDTAAWNPASDPLIPENYGIHNMSGKKKCKAALLKEFKLTGVDKPLFVSIGRLTEQKGWHFTLGLIDRIVALGGNLVLLGTGSQALEQGLKEAATRYPKSVGVKIGFDEELAHRIEAGGDFFLMPSRYEPCGLNQMYSLRYGTIPIVHKVGGLSDTVQEGEGYDNGLVFEPFELDAYSKAIERAFKLYNDTKRFTAVRQRGMQMDLSWRRSAEAYCKLYSSLL
ncbi:MAG: glycogen synthase GlgA [Methylacidiphilales bacterium]|nr:glycogen synthase GlgA [Candidatus Methylacidiphilales bacterium]MDW8348790.1 glycogen synthase GlgA [Verrucomicrobiae bacterium]